MPSYRRRTEVYVTAEHEIITVQKYRNKKNQLYAGSDKPRMLFFLLVNVKVPTFMSKKKFHAQLSSAWNFV